MKRIILFVIFNNLITSIIFSQEKIDDKTITILEGHHYAQPWGDETYKYEVNRTRRLIEFDIVFDDGTYYYLNGESGSHNDSKYQKYWNKVVTLATTQNQYDKNSVRLGWWFDRNTNEIVLGLYAHIDDGFIFGINGIESSELIRINRYEKVHVQMAITREFVYVRIKDKAALIFRLNDSWSEKGENTLVHMNAYFGDWWDLGDIISSRKYFDAPQNMYFKISNIYVDRPSFWDNYQWQDAPEYHIVNTVFHSGKILYFKSANKIVTSYDNGQSWGQSHTLPDEYKYGDVNYSFTVIKSGTDIKFIAPNVILQENTIIEQGAQVYIGPQN